MGRPKGSKNGVRKPKPLGGNIKKPKQNNESTNPKDYKSEDLSKESRAKETKIIEDEKSENLESPLTEIQNSQTTSEIRIEETEDKVDLLDKKITEKENNGTDLELLKVEKEQLEILKKELIIQKEQLEEQKEAEYRSEHNRKTSLKEKAKSMGLGLVKGAGNGLGKVASGVKDNIGLFGKILGLGILIKKFWPQIKEKLGDFVEWMADNMPPILSQVWDMVKDTTSDLMNMVLEYGPGLLKNVTKGLATVGASIMNGVLEYGPGLISMMTTAFSDLSSSLLAGIVKYGPEVGTMLWDGFKGLIKVAVPLLVEYTPKILKMLWDGISAVLNDTVDAIIKYGPDVLRLIRDGIYSSVDFVIGAVKEYGPDLLTKIQDGFGKAVDFVLDFISSPDAGKNLSDKVFGGLQTAVQFVIDKVKEYGPNIMADVKRGLTTAIDYVIEKVENYGPGIVDNVIGAVTAGLKGYFKLLKMELTAFIDVSKFLYNSVKDFGPDLIIKVVKGLGKAVQFVTDKISTALDPIISDLKVKFFEFKDNIFTIIGNIWDDLQDFIYDKSNGMFGTQKLDEKETTELTQKIEKTNFSSDKDKFKDQLADLGILNKESYGKEKIENKAKLELLPVKALRRIINKGYFNEEDNQIVLDTIEKVKANNQRKVDKANAIIKEKEIKEQKQKEQEFKALPKEEQEEIQYQKNNTKLNSLKIGKVRTSERIEQIKSNPSAGSTVELSNLTRQLEIISLSIKETENKITEYNTENNVITDEKLEELAQKTSLKIKNEANIELIKTLEKRKEMQEINLEKALINMPNNKVYQEILRKSIAETTIKIATAKGTPESDELNLKDSKKTKSVTEALFGSDSAKGNSSSFANGGWTGDGKDDEVAGVVHKNEFVLNQEMLNEINAKTKDSDSISSNNPAPAKDKKIMRGLTTKEENSLSTMISSSDKTEENNSIYYDSSEVTDKSIKTNIDGVKFELNNLTQNQDLYITELQNRTKELENKKLELSADDYLNETKEYTNLETEIENNRTNYIKTLKEISTNEWIVPEHIENKTNPQETSLSTMISDPQKTEDTSDLTGRSFMKNIDGERVRIKNLTENQESYINEINDKAKELKEKLKQMDEDGVFSESEEYKKAEQDIADNRKEYKKSVKAMAENEKLKSTKTEINNNTTNHIINTESKEPEVKEEFGVKAFKSLMRTTGVIDEDGNTLKTNAEKKSETGIFARLFGSSNSDKKEPKEDKSLENMITDSGSKGSTEFKTGIDIKKEEAYKDRFNLVQERLISYKEISNELKDSTDPKNIKKKKDIDAKIKNLEKIELKIKNADEVQAIDKEISATQKEVLKITETTNNNNELIKQLESKTDKESVLKVQELKKENKTLLESKESKETKINNKSKEMNNLGGKLTKADDATGLALKYDKDGDGELSTEEEMAKSSEEFNDSTLGAFQELMHTMGVVDDDGLTLKTNAEKKSENSLFSGFFGSNKSDNTTSKVGSAIGAGLTTMVPDRSGNTMLGSVVSANISSALPKGSAPIVEASKNAKIINTEDPQLIDEETGRRYDNPDYIEPEKGFFDGLFSNSYQRLSVGEVEDNEKAESEDGWFSGMFSSGEITSGSDTAKGKGEIKTQAQEVKPSAPRSADINEGTRKLARANQPKPVQQQEVKGNTTIIQQAPPPAPSKLNLANTKYNDDDVLIGGFL